MPEKRPASKLMRVPFDTYATIRRVAREDRRSMNHELAVLVEEALEYRKMRRLMGR